MRFTDFLKATVLISAGAATALAAIAVARAGSQGDSRLLAFDLGWWLIATAIGAWVGRRTVASTAIARLLSGARTTTALPEVAPGRMLLNRLWPLLLCTILAAGLAFVWPQIPGIAAGFTIIWSLAWRRQDAAVTAIEDRDGAQFFIEPTSPVKPMRLLRTPGLKGAFPVHGERDTALDRGT